MRYYTFGRFFEELLRVDPAHEIAGLRLNAWVSIVLFVGSTAFFVWWQVLGRRVRIVATGAKDAVGRDEPDAAEDGCAEGARPGPR